MKLLDIADVAQRSGMPASTLRFYEAKDSRWKKSRSGVHLTADFKSSARDIAQAHGGTLKLRNPPEGGRHLRECRRVGCLS